MTEEFPGFVASRTIRNDSTDGVIQSRTHDGVYVKWSDEMSPDFYTWSQIVEYAFTTDPVVAVHFAPMTVDQQLVFDTFVHRETIWNPLLDKLDYEHANELGAVWVSRVLAEGSYEFVTRNRLHIHQVNNSYRCCADCYVS